MRKSLLAAVIILAAGLATSACGGSGDSGAVPDTPLTAAQWRREANALCRDVGRKVRRVTRPQAQSGITGFVAAVIPLWKREEDGVRALVPPAELATTARALVDALGYVNVALLELHISTQRNDGQRRYDAIQRSQAAARGVRLWSRKLDLPACAKQRIP